jgi:hypothetical protein
MAAETTKLQVNFKTHKDGTLINLYADNVKELETLITDVSMLSALIKSTEAELLTNAPAPVKPEVATIAQAFNTTPVAPAAEAPGSKSCKHGPMAYKTGTSAKGPWQGYMCNSPKGSPDKCETIWVR